MKLLLFSGGLDSTALAYWLRPDQLLFIDYGQMAAGGELRAATQLAKELRLPLDVRRASCRSFGAGDLAGSGTVSDVAPEFWPFRNQLLITLAAMAYWTSIPLTVLIGTVGSDRVHPDGRREFLRTMQEVLAAQADIRLEAPAFEMTAAELLSKARVPAATLAWSFSCHRGNMACGQCRGCHKHSEAMSAIL